MNNDIKSKVKEYYGNIAKKVDNKSKCSCGCANPITFAGAYVKAIK